MNLVSTEAGEVVRTDEERQARKQRHKDFYSSKDLARSLASARRKANMLLDELKISPPEGKVEGRHAHAAIPVIFKTHCVCVYNMLWNNNREEHCNVQKTG
mgnify:CR=1 FL=1